MESKNNSSRKLTLGVLVIILLIIGLCVTTFAIVYATVSVDNNLFSTGSVDINLNDGKPVIEEHEFLFAPGMTVKKDFFIENNATCDVYYKIYFDNVEGGLADVLEVTVKDGEKVLYKGLAADLTKKGVRAADDTLRIGERRNLTVYFRYPESAGNETQNLTLSFDLCADAVQTKNNPNKLFS